MSSQELYVGMSNVPTPFELCLTGEVLDLPLKYITGTMNDYNNRVNVYSSVHFDNLLKSVELYGFFEPLAVEHTDLGLTLANGRHRLLAAVQLNLPHVPVRLDYRGAQRLSRSQLLKGILKP